MKLSAIILLSVLVQVALAVQNVNSTSSLPGVVRADSNCATFCRFRLCDIGNSGDFIPLPTGFGLTFPPSFVAQPPFVCLPDGPTVGRILRVREARVRIRSGRYIRIARLGRNSLRQRFNRNFFAAQDLDLPEFEGLSAIRRSKFRSPDQRTVLEGRCVYLPLNTWEVRRPDGSINRVVSSRDRRNCVSFLSTATTTQMKITFMWDTAADLDLSLTEPGSGFEIAFITNKSPNGGFLFEDIALGDCNIDGGMRQSVEMIEYSGLSTPPTGSYAIKLNQFASCEGLDTNWHVTVTVGDETIVDETGVLAPLGPGEDPSVFETLTFDFPSSPQPAGELEPSVIEPTEVMSDPTVEPLA